MAKKTTEKDVLIVRDEKTGEISVTENIIGRKLKSVEMKSLYHRKW